MGQVPEIKLMMMMITSERWRGADNRSRWTRTVNVTCVVRRVDLQSKSNVIQPQPRDLHAC